VGSGLKASRQLQALVDRLKRTESPIARYLLLRGAGLVHYATNGHAARRRTVGSYLSASDEPRLHIGAGPVRLEGWLDSDLLSGEIYLDITRSLPFADSTFSYIFGEHVIEHVSERAGERALHELHRVLRPGGVLRLTTPDLRKIIDIYEDRNPVVTRADYSRFLQELTGGPYERACQVFNAYTRLWGHQYIYDEEDLTAKLHAAGFGAVDRQEPGESSHAALRGLERHGGAEWVNRAEAMCLDAMA
jgi:predicted SAM-dependent methyltransferase